MQCPVRGQVRPYLEADGGDVEVVEVENGVVYLRLQVSETEGAGPRQLAPNPEPPSWADRMW